MPVTNSNVATVVVDSNNERTVIVVMLDTKVEVHLRGHNAL